MCVNAALRILTVRCHKAARSLALRHFHWIPPTFLQHFAYSHISSKLILTLSYDLYGPIFLWALNDYNSVRSKDSVTFLQENEEITAKVYIYIYFFFLSVLSIDLIYRRYSKASVTERAEKNNNCWFLKATIEEMCGRNFYSKFLNLYFNCAQKHKSNGPHFVCLLCTVSSPDYGVTLLVNKVGDVTWEAVNPLSSLESNR